MEPCNRGFYVNWTTVVGFMLTLLTIIGLWLFTYHIASEEGYHRAIADSERKELQNRLDKHEAQIAETERLLRLAINPVEEGFK